MRLVHFVPTAPHCILLCVFTAVQPIVQMFTVPAYNGRSGELILNCLENRNTNGFEKWLFVFLYCLPIIKKLFTDLLYVAVSFLRS